MPPPVRAKACSMFSTVSTPNAHGTPVVLCRSVDVELRALDEHRREERQSLCVIPVEVGQEATAAKRTIEWLRCSEVAQSRAEVEQKYHKLCPEKIELIEGKLFWTDEERLNMLALLLENVGMDAAVRLGDPTRWKEALIAAERELAPKAPGER